MSTVAERVAFRASLTKDLTVLTSQLVELLGAQLTAFIGGVEETRAVRQWMSGERSPQRAAEMRLRAALHIAKFLHEEEGDNISIAAWFQGTPQELGGQSPAFLIRNAGEDTVLSETKARILAAAREFVDA